MITPADGEGETRNLNASPDGARCKKKTALSKKSHMHATIFNQSAESRRDNQGLVIMQCLSDLSIEDLCDALALLDMHLYVDHRRTRLRLHAAFGAELFCARSARIMCLA